MKFCNFVVTFLFFFAKSIKIYKSFSGRCKSELEYMMDVMIVSEGPIVDEICERIRTSNKVTIRELHEANECCYIMKIDVLLLLKYLSNCHITNNCLYDDLTTLIFDLLDKCESRYVTTINFATNRLGRIWMYLNRNDFYKVFFPKITTLRQLNDIFNIYDD